MFDKMKQLMELKKQADQIKRELDSTNVTVEEVPGIKIEISGSQTFQSIEVSEELLNSGDKVKVEGDLLRSLNAAIKQSQNLAAEKMKGVMPGLPGL